MEGKAVADGVEVETFHASGMVKELSQVSDTNASGRPVASSVEKLPPKAKQGATRHCCYGRCNSDSRYPGRLHMNGVGWVSFPKPDKDLDKCKRWIQACSREGFTIKKVTKWTYMCTKHFVGGNGPTVEHPDPIPATYTPQQVQRFSKKRRAPIARTNPVSKKQRLEAAEALTALQTSLPVIEEDRTQSGPPQSKPADITAADQIDPTQSNTEAELVVPAYHDVGLQSAPECQDKGMQSIPVCQDICTQTTYTCKYQLEAKITAMLLKKKVVAQQASSHLTSSSVAITYESLVEEPTKIYYYTGLTVPQFLHLYENIEEYVPHLTFWRGKKNTKIKTGNGNQPRNRCKLSSKTQMLLTLFKLRHDFPNRDLAYRFDISVCTVSVIFNTWVQFLYRITATLRQRCFPSRELIREHLPPSFKTFKNVRVIIDCFEIFAEQPQDFAEQGNMYSNYKHHSTLKGLVGIAPTGGITFMSDMYEGSISDKEIVEKSGLLELLNPDDLVIADRGFDIKDMLEPRQVCLNIPPFLKNRIRLTPQEEILTKRIARVRIHVERAIERMKNFKIIARRLPLTLKPIISQIVHVIGFLVNYQQPLVK